MHYALQQSSALASEDYSSQSDEKSNTKPGVGVTLGLYSFMRPASYNNAGVICVVYGGKEHCGYCSYAVLRVCYRFTTLRALQSGKPVKDQRAPVSWWLWCGYVLSFFTIRRVIGTATVNGQRRWKGILR